MRQREGTTPTRAHAGNDEAGNDEASRGSAEARLVDRVVRLSVHLRRQAIEFETAIAVSGRELDLVLLICANDSIVMKEAATDLRVSPSTLSTMVDRLARQGLVERRVNPDDARSFVLAPTAESRRIYARFRELIERNIRGAGILGEVEGAPALAELFKRLEVAIGARRGEG